MQELRDIIDITVKSLFNSDKKIELFRPDERFGDYSTNIALQLAADQGKPAKEIAETVASKLTSGNSDLIVGAEVAGSGFINIKLTDQALLKLSKMQLDHPMSDKSVVVEYSDANPFKILHAGHLYTSIIGDAIANILSNAGANVHRVNFGGDVGLHVAKSLWAINKNLGGFDPSKLDHIPTDQRSDWLSERYIEGNKAYEEDEQAKSDITKLNEQIYEIVSNDDHDSDLAKIYWTCRQWSYDYFEDFYKTLGIKFEKYYPESSVFKLGLKTVKENIPKVYQESQGAVVFKGEDYGLFTNVFINSQGLPTYSAKDVGLMMQKWQDYHPDKSVIITSNEQSDYMRVVLKSVEQFEPDLAKATDHLTHGAVKLSGGVKMSSRLGNFLKATDIIEAAEQAGKNIDKLGNNMITIAAVKYSFLKQAIGPDIIYDPQESVSLEGNSGPYLQYARVRAANILNKAESKTNDSVSQDLQPDERSLVLKISEFNEVIDKSVKELKPHYVCTYLYELAQKFNSFYEKNRVVGDQRQELRLNLVKLYLEKLDSGLAILGISTPDKM